MSLFQCQNCGCRENTALACQGCDGYAETFFDWTGIEDRRGKKLCSVCAPTKYSDGRPTEFGVWHGKFEREFLPMGAYRTGRDGNLERIPGVPLHSRYEGGWYFCWLIERRDRAQPEWWGVGGWVIDANNALWFARQSDADTFAGEMTEDVTCCEHGFMLARPAI